MTGVRQRCEDAGTEYYDMMTDAVVVHRNACITAEATVAEILKYSDYSIRGRKLLSAGMEDAAGRSPGFCLRWEQK